MAQQQSLDKEHVPIWGHSMVAHILSTSHLFPFGLNSEDQQQLHAERALDHPPHYYSARHDLVNKNTRCALGMQW